MRYLRDRPAEEFEMKLEWREESLGGGRVDLDLSEVNGKRIGFFRDYLRKPLEFRCYKFSNDLFFPDLTLEEAKKVVEAMIHLEG